VFFFVPLLEHPVGAPVEVRCWSPSSSGPPYCHALVLRLTPAPPPQVALVFLRKFDLPPPLYSFFFLGRPPRGNYPFFSSSFDNSVSRSWIIVAVLSTDASQKLRLCQILREIPPGFSGEFFPFFVFLRDPGMFASSESGPVINISFARHLLCLRCSFDPKSSSNLVSHMLTRVARSSFG